MADDRDYPRIERYHGILQRLQKALWFLKHDNRVPEVDLDSLDAQVVGLERTMLGEAAFDLVERERVLVAGGLTLAVPVAPLVQVKRKVVVRRRGVGGAEGQGGAAEAAAEG